MARIPFPEQPPPESAPPAADALDLKPLDVIRLLRSAGSGLLTQAALHGQLLRVELAEEKTRLLKMHLLTLLGLACLLCVMLFTGLLVLTASWDTDLRIPALLFLIAVSGFATAMVWRRFKALSDLSSKSFAATREELAADMALLKSKL